jgi:hypothetical protein
MKKLVLVPECGLCNRMRAMASGVYLAEKQDFDCTVYWEKVAECYVNFEEIFEKVNLPDIKIISYEPLKNRFRKIFLDRNKPTNFSLPKILRAPFFDLQYVDYQGNDNPKTDNKRVFVRSMYSFAEHYPLTELFVPRKEIQTEINKIVSRFADYTVGFHIRRTDHTVAKARNTVEDFIAAMKKEIAENEQVKFFIATDDLEVKRCLIERFGEKIIVYEKAELSRSSEQGMRDAVIDLWCLSRTAKIYGSFTSSFSETAAEMGGVELIIL